MKEVLKKVNSINTIAKPVSKGSVMSKEFHLIVNRIDKKLDAMDDRLNSMNETLIRQEGNLSEHMRRTEALEKIVAPIKEDVQKIKFLGVVAGVVGSIVTGLALFLANFQKAMSAIRSMFGQ